MPVYFIQDSLTFRIKIGHTGKEDVSARLKELQTGNSSLLYLLASREGSVQVERDLHEQFAQYRAQGEWFDPGPELLQYIIGCSANRMAHEATQAAVSSLLAKSFPETKAEKERRQANEQEEKRQLLAQAEAEKKRLEKVMRWNKAKDLFSRRQFYITRYSKGEGPSLKIFMKNYGPRDRLLNEDEDKIEKLQDELISLFIDSGGEVPK